MSAAHVAEGNTLSHRSSKERMAWADLARGGSMILVVLMHVDQLHFAAIFPPSVVTSMWDVLTSVMRPVRMPLFFMISGLLAASAITRPWSTALRGRLYSLAYLYILWLALYAVASELGAQVGRIDDEKVGLAGYAWQLLWPRSILWYLYALILYFVAAKLLRNVNTVVVLGLAGLLSAFSDFLPFPSAPDLARSFFYYLLGLHFTRFWSQLANDASWRRLGLAGLAYGASVGLILVLGEDVAGIWIPSGLAGICLGVTAAAMLSKIKYFDVVTSIGRNTLPIFVLHGLIIAAINMFAVGPGSAMFSYIASIPILTALYPVFVNVAVIGLSLAIYSVLKLCGQGYLFHPPPSRVHAGYPTTDSSRV